MDGWSEGQHPQGQTGAGTPQHGQTCLCWKADGCRNHCLAGASWAMGNFFAARAGPGGPPLYYENTYFFNSENARTRGKKVSGVGGRGPLKPMQNMGSGSKVGAGSRGGNWKQDETHAGIKHAFKRPNWFQDGINVLDASQMTPSSLPTPSHFNFCCRPCFRPVC